MGHAEFLFEVYTVGEQPSSLQHSRRPQVIPYIFRAIVKYRQNFYQQNALILEYESTPTCVGHRSQPS
jgi:hypothetical protein